MPSFRSADSILSSEHSGLYKRVGASSQSASQSRCSTPAGCRARRHSWQRHSDHEFLQIFVSSALACNGQLGLSFQAAMHLRSCFARGILAGIAQAALASVVSGVCSVVWYQQVELYDALTFQVLFSCQCSAASGPGQGLG